MMELAGPVPSAAVTRRCLDVSDLTDAEVQHVFHRARRFRDLFERRDTHVSRVLPPTLTGQVVATLFFEPSTRTRLSFELAAQRLHALVLPLDTESSSLRKAETLADTLRTMEAMGVTVAVLRHSDDRIFDSLPPGLRLALINAGNGTQAHPTQALLDAFTLGLRWHDFAGKTVVIAGDVAHSRVARSSSRLLARLGARVILTGPPSLRPKQDEDPGFGSARFLQAEEALPLADAMMCLRVQRERHYDAARELGEREAPLDLGEGAYLLRHGLTEERFQTLKPSCLLLHPGPVNRGCEIAESLVEHPRSLILEQVRSGVFVRMALLEWICGVLP
jgi:aspartate carbamoyltransferase catalytic subunit